MFYKIDFFEMGKMTKTPETHQNYCQILFSIFFL